MRSGNSAHSRMRSSANSGLASKKVRQVLIVRATRSRGPGAPAAPASTASLRRRKPKSAAARNSSSLLRKSR